MGCPAYTYSPTLEPKIKRLKKELTFAESKKTAQVVYLYGFNGKEQDSGSEWGGQNNYDYGFRIYNPSIGRFLSVDPLARDFPWNSSYAFAENDVIRSIDLEGLEKLVMTQETEALMNNFLDILESDDILKKQVKDPISKPELADKVHVYFVMAEHFGYSRTPGTKGIMFRAFDVKAMVNSISEYDSGDPFLQRKHNKHLISKNRQFFDNAGLNTSELKGKIDSGVDVFIVGVNRKKPNDEKELTLLHEVYLHLRRFNDSKAIEDHLWGFGEEAYPPGSNPLNSPSPTPENSRLGKMEKRFKDAKEKHTNKKNED